MADSITSPMHTERETGLSGLVDQLFDPLEVDALRSRVLARVFGAPTTSPRLGRYRVLDAIGRGAMGSVFAAYDEKLDRKVAIKILHASAEDADARERLLREARALGRLSHPNAVQVHDAGEWNGHVFVAMELVSGPTLRDWLDAQPRSPTEILARFCEAAHGLAAAHEAGVVHRDFKPENVLVGEDARVRVADFGLAFATLQETRDAIASASDGRLDACVLTRTGLVLGTPAYMAPEQLRGERVDPRTDQFSFAVALHEALFGERPFRGDTLGALDDAIAQGPPTPQNAGRVPLHVRLALARALAYEPEQRFGSMRDLLAALGATPPARRRRMPVVLSTVATAPVGAVVVVGSSASEGREIEGRLLAAKLSAAETVHARERDATRLAEAAALVDEDPTAAAAELARIEPDGWTPEADRLLAIARARGVAFRVVRFDPTTRPVDARTGRVRWEEAGGAVAFDAVSGHRVAAPVSGVWADTGGALFRYHDSGLQVWPVDGSGLRTLSIAGDDEAVFLAVAPDGTHAALYRDDVVTVFDVGSGESTSYEGFPALDVSTAALAPGGRELAEVASDGRLVVHDLEERTQLVVAKELAGVIRYSPDGRWLAGVRADSRLALVDRRSGVALDSPSGSINAFAFAPTSDRLVACSTDVPYAPTAIVWSLPTFRQLATIGAEARAACHVDFSSDGGVVVVASPSHDAQAVDLRTGWAFTPRGGPPLQTATISGDGQSLTTVHEDELRVWSLEGIRRAAPIQEEWSPGHLSYTNEGDVLLTDIRGAVLFQRARETMRPLVEVGGDPVFRDDEHPRIRSTAAVLRPRGLSWAETLPSRGAKLVLPGHSPRVILDAHALLEVATSPDGARVYALPAEGAPLVHEIERGVETRLQDGCPTTELVRGLATRQLWVAHDGARLGAAGFTGRLCVWDTESGEVVATHALGVGRWLTSPDLRRALHAPENTREPARLVDLEGGTISELPQRANWVALTSDGTLLFLADGMIWASDPSMKTRWPLVPSESLLTAAVAPDEREVALFGWGRGMRFVSIDPPEAASPAVAAGLTEIVRLAPVEGP